VCTGNIYVTRTRMLIVKTPQKLHTNPVVVTSNQTIREAAAKEFRNVSYI
jgi:hypothetical protein